MLTLDARFRNVLIQIDYIMDIHHDQLLDKLEELQRELAEAQMQNALFPNYLAGLSHDIRTPLNAVVGFAGLLTEPDLEPEQLKFYSYMITRSSRKLLSMISNLIDLAKMETGSLRIFNDKVNVSELLDEIRDEMEEERRNCFVAITRSMKTLTLSYAESYRGWHKEPSRFLFEMGLL